MKVLTKIKTNEIEKFYLKLFLDEDSVSIETIVEIWRRPFSKLSISKLKNCEKIRHYIFYHTNDKQLLNPSNKFVCTVENCEFKQNGGNHGSS